MPKALSEARTSSQASGAVVSDQKPSSQASGAVVSDAKKRANRRNAQKSTGPKTEEGKNRSSMNAIRHGILSQVIHLPAEEMKGYTEFCNRMVEGYSPVGILETELARSCADMQYRLNRVAASEHNLFAIGHHENGNKWETGHPESHTAMTLAETIRSSDPLKTLSTYESRLHRRFMQTMKQLRELQAERRALEQTELEQLTFLASQSPETAEKIEPSDFGSVCSKASWLRHWRRICLLHKLASGPSSSRNIQSDNPQRTTARR